MQQPVLVRNTEAGPTVFSDPSQHIAIEWQGAGDPEGNDVQHVPAEIVTTNINFLRSLQRGIFQVEEATDEIKEKLALQVKGYRQRRSVSERATEEVIDRKAEEPIASAVISETGKVIDGVPEETNTPVIIAPREKQAL